MKGNAGPVNPKDASETPLTATLDLKHFDPVAAGVVQANQGISMLADITAQITSNGQSAHQQWNGACGPAEAGGQWLSRARTRLISPTPSITTCKPEPARSTIWASRPAVWSCM